MYCPVYGCYSNSQKHTDEKIHFFEFPKASKGPEEIKRHNIWINVSAKISLRQEVHGFAHYTSAQMPSTLPVRLNFLSRLILRVHEG